MKSSNALVVCAFSLPAFIEGFAGGGGCNSGWSMIPAVHCQSSLTKKHLRVIQPRCSEWRKNGINAWYSGRPKRKLCQSETKYDEFDKSQQEEQQTDPIVALVKDAESMDINALINTVTIALVAVAVLSKLATIDQGIMRGWTAAEMAVRIPVDNWNGYSTILGDSPVRTKAITSATVYTIGDFIAQRTEGKSIGGLDRVRILRSLLAGLIGHGPLSHIWYEYSERLFSDILHWTEWWSFFPKVMLDQATWGPFWNNVYILLVGLMKRDNLNVIWSDVKRTTIPLLISGLKLWPLAHCITYGLVPVENRLLWVDLVEILWVTILASQAAGGSGVEGGAHAAPSDEDSSLESKTGSVIASTEEVLPEEENNTT